MPNHCSNTLHVKGGPNYLNAFKRKFLVYSNTSPLTATYENIFPTPLELLSDVSPLPKNDGESNEDYSNRMRMYKEKYGYDNWYDWRWANWDTKWDVYDFYLHFDLEDHFSCDFQSAWSPPLGWFNKAVTSHKNLEFSLDYIEEGASFCGLATGINGEYSNQYSDIQYQDEDGKVVRYNSDKGLYVYEDGHVINDEDFWPIAVNPLVD